MDPITLPQQATMLTTASACQEYICAHSPAKLALHLRQDQQLCMSGRLPSILALHLPHESPLADAIAEHLARNDTYGHQAVGRGFHHNIRKLRKLQYDGILQSIEAYLSKFQPGRKFGETDTGLHLPNILAVPTTQEFETAIKVLEYLEKVPAVKVATATTLGDIFTAIRLHIALDPGLRATYKSLPEKLTSDRGHKHGRTREYKHIVEGVRELKRCYMCNYRVKTPHSHYQSLCIPCGSFNLQESALSLPTNLNLSRKTALVTGGRENFGFHIALRLLRCGANVVVSSRYPFDTETRYRAQTDFKSWEGRIRIIGADLRAAKDAFTLVAIVKDILGEWAQDGITDSEDAKLNILINNAAQTLTNSVREEQIGVDRERELRARRDDGVLRIIAVQDYQPMVRVGEEENQRLLGLSVKNEQAGLNRENSIKLNRGLSEAAPDVISTTADKTKQKSSWTQSLNQIPYEDVVTAQVVNVFVPLILIRELLPLMGSHRPGVQHGLQVPAIPRKPLGYIINVSSSEGLPESHPSTAIKGSHHVHTNMAKAALNMLTETEASLAWRLRRVAMNSVDPGYMSASDGSECPIGWEDGAARALWCVAKGEIENVSIWGRVLKHFGGVGVVVRQP